MPTKPGGCNRSHIPKALEHPTGLTNPQPSHELPAPGPLQAPLTLKPDGSVERKKNAENRWGRGNRKRTPRTAKLLEFNPQLHANRATNTLQAHGTTTHVLRILLDNVSPRAPSTMTAANATERTKRLTNATRRPRH